MKRFLELGDVHIPFLLRVAAAPAEILAGAHAPPVNDAGEIELDDEDDDEDQPTEEELQAEEAAEPEMMKAAIYWDNFCALVRNCQEPWEATDTDAYREKRAVEAFNHAAQDSGQRHARAQPRDADLGVSHCLLHRATPNP